jgi:hypothetical protein
MLRGELACPDMEADDMVRMLHVPMRIPEKMVERADALLPLLTDDPRFEDTGIDRAKLLRKALAIGLAQLERDVAVVVPERAARTSKRTRGSK